MRYVAAEDAWLHTEIVDTIVCVDDGTVYRVVADVADGFDCPRTLYVVAIDYFSLSYIPPNSNAVGAGSVAMVAHEAVLPFVVKYFPEFPDCDGNTYALEVSKDTVGIGPVLLATVIPVPADTAVISPWSLAIQDRPEVAALS